MSDNSSRLGFCYWGIACLVLSLVGFWPSYVAPTISGTYKSPSPTMQLHVACISLWLILLVSQPLLIHMNRRVLHRWVGVFGIVVALGVVLTGVSVQIDVMPSYAAHGDEANAILIPFIRFTLLLVFAICVGMALFLRHRVDWRSRLMFFGTFPVLQSPLDRLFGNVLGLPAVRGVGALAGHIFLMILFLTWDRLAHGRVHPVSKWGTIWLTLFFLVSPTAAMTDWWAQNAGALAETP